MQAVWTPIGRPIRRSIAKRKPFSHENIGPTSCVPSIGSEVSPWKTRCYTPITRGVGEFV